MVDAPGTDLVIRYEGGSAGTEIWGMTQANFLVGRLGHPGKEVAVTLNETAAEFLAGEVGEANTDEFRQEAARRVGELVIGRFFAQHGRVDSLLVVSRATFDEHPDLLDQLKAPASP